MSMRIGWILSGIVILFLVMDLAMKFAVLQPVIDTMAALGWPTDAPTIHILAILLAIGTGLYAWPRTALLGAILLTGYLGGAIATHARLGNPLLTHTLFGAYLGVAAWGGLWLRDPAVRALLPIRK
ncbi:DoxX family protein [Sphingosinithalassobacter portus]|uniref:DoxX family protein n=1 Tax=Stakelama portus TaxID=2676234 RepID=UPI001960362D|nr:DoxX family protein [Sphingosinithalassobacter portus]